MQNVMTGQAAARTAAPTYTPEGQLVAFKKALTGLLATSEVITDAEFQRAATPIAQCESLPTLQKWYRNCVREIATREELAPATALITYATAAQKEEVVKLASNLYILRAEKTKALLGLPRYNEREARALIGELWVNILHRRERDAEGQADASRSFCDAA
jgi:hypothetical protein